MIKLFGSETSPFVRHCRIALEQGKLPYEFVIVDYQNTAQNTPTQKMPYLVEDDLKLTDSSSILKFIREKSGLAFLAELEDFERYTLANTMLDAAINLFLLEKEEITPKNSQYLQRQSDRIQTSMQALEQGAKPQQAMLDDSHIRISGMMEWLSFRNRLDTTPYTQLNQVLNQAKADQLFQDTAPPS